jgi:hypothetical protein
MNIFEGLQVGRPWQVRNRRFLTPWEYLQVVSATVVQSQFGYSVEFLLKNGENNWVPLSIKCYADDIEGTVIDPLDIEVLTLEQYGDTIYRIEF